MQFSSGFVQSIASSCKLIWWIGVCLLHDLWFLYSHCRWQPCLAWVMNSVRMQFLGGLKAWKMLLNKLTCSSRIQYEFHFLSVPFCFENENCLSSLTKLWLIFIELEDCGFISSWKKLALFFIYVFLSRSIEDLDLGFRVLIFISLTFFQSPNISTLPLSKLFWKVNPPSKVKAVVWILVFYINNRKGQGSFKVVDRLSSIFVSFCISLFNNFVFISRNNIVWCELWLITNIVTCFVLHIFTFDLVLCWFAPLKLRWARKFVKFVCAITSEYSRHFNRTFLRKKSEEAILMVTISIFSCPWKIYL